MENPIPSIARGVSSVEMCARGKRRQPDSRPTRMSAIKPPRNKAARIHSTTGGRLRINPRGGSFCCAKSSESAPLSSAGWRSPCFAAGAVAGSWGTSLNSRGTLTMLAPKKRGRQANARPSERSQDRPPRFSHQSCGVKKPECANRASARQYSYQRECRDCTRQDCQRHPASQPRMRFRQGK